MVSPLSVNDAAAAGREIIAGNRQPAIVRELGAKVGKNGVAALRFASALQQFGVPETRRRPEQRDAFSVMLVRFWSRCLSMPPRGLRLPDLECRDTATDLNTKERQDA